MQEFNFKVRSILGKEIRVTEGYWELITKEKHPDMEWEEERIKQTLADAYEVRKSLRDPAVFLYYRKYNSYWITVVCRHENGTGFVITTYKTDRIKDGERVWQK